MRYPTRYSAAGTKIVETDPAGPLVEYVDYEILKAEVERLDALCKQLMAQHSDISCENIRLRKAGDKLVEVIQEMDVIIDMDCDHSEVDAWNAAKEGKPNA